MKFILLPLTIVSLMISSAFAGPRIVGNGGDVYALQFVVFAEKVLLYLQNSDVKGLDTEALAKVIASAKVESTDQNLKLKGLPKDAINYPSEKKIVFNRGRWTSMLTDERLALVLHEYLGLMGLEQANYEYSKLLLKDMTTIERVRPGADSSWLLCQDDDLVLNIYEHRDGPDTRATTVTLLKGGWVLEGVLKDSNSGPLTLNEKSQRGSFTGDISISYNAIDDNNHKVTLKGVMTLFKNVIQVNKSMKCQGKHGRE